MTGRQGVKRSFFLVIPESSGIQDGTPAFAGVTSVVIPESSGIQDGTPAFAGVTSVVIPESSGIQAEVSR
jgi:hypothetical protein